MSCSSAEHRAQPRRLSSEKGPQGTAPPQGPRAGGWAPGLSMGNSQPMKAPFAERGHRCPRQIEPSPSSLFSNPRKIKLPAQPGDARSTPFSAGPREPLASSLISCKHLGSSPGCPHRRRAARPRPGPPSEEAHAARHLPRPPAPGPRPAALMPPTGGVTLDIQ